MTRALIAALMGSLLAIPSAQAWVPHKSPTRTGTTYYVSAAGSDTNNGTSTATPWQTIGQLYSRTWTPGDKLLFRGGDTFNDNILYLDNTNSTNVTNPIVIGSYGTGRATIALAGGSNVIFAYNLGGIEFRDLILNCGGTGSGIAVENPTAGVTLSHLVFDNLDISGCSSTSSGGAVPGGFPGNGIAIYSDTSTSLYRDVTFTNSTIHDNLIGGINIYASTGTEKLMSGLYIGGNNINNIPGLAGLTLVSGVPILAKGVSNAVVERNTVHDAGSASNSASGPAGIFFYISDSLLYQYNEVYNIFTGGSTDGLGIDFDGGVTNSIAQYNYTHNNDGAGIGVFQYPGSPATSNNIVRYNVSENDGQKASVSESGITLYAADGAASLTNTKVYNNTVYVGAGVPSSASPIFVSTATTNTKLYNNILYAASGHNQLDVLNVGTGLEIQGNLYWTPGGAFSAFYNGTGYTSLATFRSATGQEKNPVSTGTATGLNVDPVLTNAGGGGTVAPSPLIGLSAYRLLPSSGAIGQGLNLSSLFSVNPGPFDFYGNTTPQSTTFDIGAHEFVSGATLTIGDGVTPLTIGDGATTLNVNN